MCVYMLDFCPSFIHYLDFNYSAASAIQVVELLKRLIAVEGKIQNPIQSMPIDG